jgi:hypothetical protein
MIKHAREQFLLSANELVDSPQRNDSLSYWSLIRKLMKGTSQNYSITPLYDNDSNITRAIFHVDGNMPFCNEKLKIIAKGIQMVSEVLLNI